METDENNNIDNTNGNSPDVNTRTHIKTAPQSAMPYKGKSKYVCKKCGAVRYYYPKEIRATPNNFLCLSCQRNKSDVVTTVDTKTASVVDTKVTIDIPEVRPLSQETRVIEDLDTTVGMLEERVVDLINIWDERSVNRVIRYVLDRHPNFQRVTDLLKERAK